MTDQHSLEPDDGYPVIPPPPEQADTDAPAYGTAATQPYGAHPGVPAVPPPGAPMPPAPYGSVPYGAPPTATGPAQYPPQPPYPAAPQPPYAAHSSPAAPPHPHAGPQLPPPPVWGGQPQAPAKPASGSPRWVTPAIIIGITAGVIVLVVLIGSLLATGIFASPRQSAPDEPVATAPAVPSDETAADGDIIADPATIAEQLQAKIDAYRDARKDGSLWKRLEHTDFNDTAVSAYLFFLTDMQVAATWGIDAADAKEYAADANRYEQRLLAGEPLGDDVHIEFETRTFDYDGATGEGGFTDN